MATQGGPAQPVSVVTSGPVEGGAAIPVAVVTDGRAVVGGPAQRVVVVTSGPVQGGPARPIVAAPSGAVVQGGPAIPVYVVSGSFSGAFSPDQLGDLAVWLDASQLTGLTDGAAVSTFTDKSGNGRSPTALTTARPTYKTNIVGGLPVVRFDGVDDAMAVTFGATLAQPTTIFAVEKHTTPSSNKYVFDGIDATNRQALITSVSSMSMYAGVTRTAVVAPGAWRVWCITFKASPDLFYVNDGLISSADAGSGSLAGLTLGARWDKFVGSWLGMDLAELIVYTRALTATERRQVLRYLIAKWGFITDPNRASSTGNAATFQTTPTYDGSGQTVHPDIYYNAAGWNGWKYWMAITPYPNNDNQLENPSILVSNDGNAWQVPVGLTNPIVAAPGLPSYNSDPCLLFVSGTLYLFHRQTSTTNDTIFALSSTDGVTWSAPATVCTGVNNRVVAPSVVYDGTQYVMFHIDIGAGSPYQWNMRTCATPNGTYSAATRIWLDPPAGQDLWHITVFWDTATSMYHALIATVPSGTNGGTPGYLYFATSNDGLAWVLADTPLLSPPGGSAWDGYEIYRAAGVRTATGYDLWYSARSTATSPTVWHIGRTSMVLP